MEEFNSLPPFSSPSNEDYLVDVSGKMDSIPSISKPTNGEGKPEFNTLDEPIRLTIVRDLKAVGNKFFHVLYPRQQTSLLTEWDLWGPLILCTFMALLLQGRSDSTDHDGGPEFAEVFVIVWVGAMAVTINTKLLGGTISFFQSVCVLGYCLLPLSIALALCRIVLLLQQNTLFFVLRCGFSLTAFFWAVWAAIKFLGDSSPPRRKILAGYPIGLFYFVIAWLVVSLSNS
ncbi:protein YIPF6-like [Daphnia pulex]|uniref:protein YIPF6-like n=1 Tax=Daphnia pulex TaxID=6669 RepID=UPI001EDD1AB9|nr:protein YIPF6-like [Daphnia pulex]XP_046646570.1 protein YIPF6-like [Daphnia pulicaria]